MLGYNAGVWADTNEHLPISMNVDRQLSRADQVPDENKAVISIIPTSELETCVYRAKQSWKLQIRIHKLTKP